jgi:hypothetical protein
MSFGLHLDVPGLHAAAAVGCCVGCRYSGRQSYDAGRDGSAGCGHEEDPGAAHVDWAVNVVVAYRGAPPVMAIS